MNNSYCKDCFFFCAKEIGEYPDGTCYSHEDTVKSLASMGERELPQCLQPRAPLKNSVFFVFHSVTVALIFQCKCSKVDYPSKELMIEDTHVSKHWRGIRG